VIAIDWSGRKGADQRRVIWLGDAHGGALARLEAGRTRTELVDLLIAEADRYPNLVVGLDFAFSLPGWYLRERHLTPRGLWSAMAAESLTPSMNRLGLSAWMNQPEPPFWTIGKADALAGRQEFRQTELDVRALGSQPKSVFQLVGGGQVGRMSLYGMQALHRLALAGFRIWPFDAPGLPLVVEIFPRLLTGAVVKTSPSARAEYLAAFELSPELRERAATSDDAFDAAISAVVMERAAAEFTGLADEPAYMREGKIWQSSVPQAATARPAAPRLARSAGRPPPLSISVDVDRAKRFIDAIPEGRSASYKDVATASGNPRAAQAIGDWLRREAHDIPRCYRVLRSNGHVADAYRPAESSLAEDAAQVREVLAREGVHISATGHAAPSQRFVAVDRAGRQGRAKSDRLAPASEN